MLTLLSRPSLWSPDLLLVLCLVGFALGKRLVLLPAWTQLNLDVYRRGAATLVAGRSIYESVPGQFPFTYPPFAAILMLPLGIVGRAVAIAALATLSLAAFALICVITMRRLRIDRRLGWFLALGAISLQPVYQTFELGQINLVLMAFVILDCLVLPPDSVVFSSASRLASRSSPASSSSASSCAAIGGPSPQSGVSFVATVLVGAVATPHETMSYWTNLGGAAARTGDAISAVNQSLPAVVARLMHDRYPPMLVVILVSLSSIALAAWAARKQLIRDQHLAALVCIAIGGLLSSPVSWSHHYV